MFDGELTYQPEVSMHVSMTGSEAILSTRGETLEGPGPYSNL